MRSLPRTHAQGVKQSFLSVIVVGTKIARSRDLGIQATCKHNESLEFGKKLVQYASNRLARPTKVTNSAFCWPHLLTAPTALQAMCSLLMCTTGLVWVGKGRQQIHDYAAAAARCCNSQIDADAACGVCVLQRSSYHT